MKKLISFVCILILVSGISVALGEKPESEMIYAESDIDLDLANMSGTMVYAQIYQLLSDYEAYEGKIIRMKGWYDVYQDEQTGKIYYSCIIPDATACCAQGIEFIWAGEHLFPDDYPEPGTGVMVTGQFETYMEDEYMYVHLVEADVVWKVMNGDTW